MINETVKVHGKTIKKIVELWIEETSSIETTIFFEDNTKISITPYIDVDAKFETNRKDLRLKYNINLKNKKWAPILETLNVDENNYDLFTTYAEQLSGDIDLDPDENLLPVNLKILSKLDFNNITLTDIENTEVIEIKETFDVEEIKAKMNTETEKDIIPLMEDIILDKFTTLLNSKKEILIYRLVNQIGIKENGGNIEMFVRGRIKMI